jgi:asparagine synthetase B (glutamine-hydrolysing)
MPHFAGILDLRPDHAGVMPVVRRVARLLDVAAAEYETRTWTDHDFGYVTLLNASGSSGPLDQPAVSADGRTVLFLDGSIYGVRSGTAGAQSSVTAAGPESAARLCLALYERVGADAAALLDGAFNVTVYDTRDRSVTVFNDRLAYRPLYYASRGGVTAFALERKAVLAALDHAADIDPLAALELFTFGHHLEDRTLFQGVRAMPQGSVLRIDADGVSVRQYWRPAYSQAREDRRMRLHDAADEFGRRLVAATRARARNGERKAIFLSGGLDSRAAAGALARSLDPGEEVAAFTFGGDASPDVRFARQLAARLGFRHRQLTYSSDCYLPALPRVVWRTEGAVPFHNCTSVEQHRHMVGHADVIFNGHFGDALTGGHILPQQLLATTTGRLVDHILAKRSNLRLPDLRRVFSDAFLDRHYPEMRDAVRRGLEAFDEDRAPLRYNLWDISVRQARYTFNSPAIDRYLFEQITPFVAGDVVDWALRIPLRYLVGQRAYKHMIVRSFPEIADVPWARTSRPVPTSFTADVARQGATYLRKRMGRLVPGRRPAHASPAPRMLTDPRLRMRIEQYLASGSALAGAFDRQRVRAMLDEHFGSGPAAVYEVSSLLTLAEATRVFIDSPLAAPPAEAEPDLGSAPESIRAGASPRAVPA